MLIANIAIVATVLAWGIQIPFMAELLHRYEPWFLSVWRYAPAAPLLLLVLWLREGAAVLPRAGEWGRLWLLGVVGIAGFAVTYTLGIRYADPVLVAIISSSAPITSAAIAWALRGDRPNRHLAVASVLAILGCLLASLDVASLLRGDGARIGFRGGELLIVLAQAIWSWYSIKAQEWFKGSSQLRLTSLTVATATGALVAIYAACLGSGAVPPPAPPGAGDAWMLAFLVVGPVMIGAVGWNTAVRHLGIVLCSIALNLMPVVAVLAGIPFGYKPTFEQLGGGLIVLAGIVYAQLMQARARRAA
ncbi:MAG: DMT family transporter [Alphaproteobacteria bacterium]|nr:DMT family transporter [Alphaproteobacteria bacterium]